MNRTIKTLMLADLVALTAFGLIDPILAIFISGQIPGGTILAAGIASTLFLITKSVVQLPFSLKIDRHITHAHTTIWLLGGTLIFSAVPFLYLVARDIPTIWLIQILHGLGNGLAYPAWLGLWSTHLDPKKESFEWSLYSTLTGIGTAITATIGAALVEVIGFNWTFVIVGCFSLLSSVILTTLYLHQKKILV